MVKHFYFLQFNWTHPFAHSQVPKIFLWPIDRALSGATTPGQSGSGNDGNEGYSEFPKALTPMEPHYAINNQPIISFIQRYKLPFSISKYRYYLPYPIYLMPLSLFTFSSNRHTRLKLSVFIFQYLSDEVLSLILTTFFHFIAIFISSSIPAQW